MLVISPSRGKNFWKGWLQVDATISCTSEIKIEAGWKDYIDCIIEIKVDQTVEVPKYMVEVVGRFNNVMLPKLPKDLSPQRNIDHKIKLELGARPLVHVPY